MGNIFQDSYVFLYKRWDDIVLVVLFFLIGLIYVVLNNIQMNGGDNSDSIRKTSKTIIIEGLDSNIPESTRKQKQENKSVAVTVYETDTTKDDTQPQTENINTDICAKYDGKSHLQQTHCNSLADSVCRVSSCCILAHEKEQDTYTCVAGNKSGAVYDESENEKGTLVPIDFDYWYYKNKCYGDKKQCASQE